MTRFLTQSEIALVKRALRFDCTLRNADYDLANIVLKLDAKLEELSTVLKHVKEHTKKLPPYLAKIVSEFEARDDERGGA